MDTSGSGDFINEIHYDKNGDVVKFSNYDREDCTRTSCDGWEINPFDYYETSSVYGGNITGETLNKFINDYQKDVFFSK